MPKDTFIGVPNLLIMSTINGMGIEGDLETACEALLTRKDMRERDKVAVAFTLGCLARDVLEEKLLQEDELQDNADLN